MRLILLGLGFVFSTIVAAQPDAYHTDLVNFFATQYTLSGETYPLYDTETETLANVGSYGVSTSTRAADAGDDFSRVATITVPQAYDNRWNAGWNLRNTQVVPLGDKLLWVVWLRALPNSDGDAVGKVGIFAERNDTYAKEVDFLVDVSSEWQRYLIPFEVSQRTHPASGLTLGFHLGAQQQVIEVAGFAVFNYGPDVPLDQLPSNLNNDQYGGFETDAAWRAPAQQRIEQLRKANVDFTLLDTDGNPLPGENIVVQMTEHDFKFGTAIKSCRFRFGGCSNATFRERLFDLDGSGRGFNSIVYENDLKWPAWEDEWISPNEYLTQNIANLGEQGVFMRGHVLLWPSWQNLPNDMQANRNNPDYLVQRVEDHIRLMLEEKNFDEHIKDWDVLNEPNTNTDLAAALAGTPGYVTGREIYARAFELADELAPDADLYINDYVTMTLKNTSGGIYDQYQGFIQELIDADAPIDGIGFQAHISSSPNSIYDVLGTLDDFHDKFGLKAKITEFDIQPGAGDELAATYLTDFLTAVFSHESVNGFFMWNFWDTDTWANPSANFFDANWNPTPSRDAFMDLVYGEWWTEEDLTTDASGNASVSAFKGSYILTVDCNGETVRVEMELLEDGAVTLDCGQLVSLRDLPLPAGSVAASPNPTSDEWNVTNALSTPLAASLYDLAGRRVWDGALRPGSNPLSTTLPAGVYTLRFTDGERASSLRLVRR